VIRSERWRLPQGPEQHNLEQYWPQVFKEAESRGLASVWRLHNEAEQLAGLVTIAGPAASEDPSPPDDLSLRTLESSPSLFAVCEQSGWVSEFDRTSWVLTIWFPIAEGQPDVPALWPNSPPLPAPEYALAAH